MTELLSKTPPKNQKIKVRNIATTVKEIEQYSDHEIDDDFLQEEEDVLQDNAQSDNYIENRPYSDNEEDDESVSRDGDSDLRVEENYQGSNLARKVHDAIDESKFRETVQMLFEEEENLLNMHMSVIQVSNRRCHPSYLFCLWSR